MQVMALKLLLSLTLIFISTQVSGEQKNQPKIIIVGAGLAGLSAAMRLMENGFTNIIILEAENRVGGRIYSEKFAGGYIDLGAQWVHGVKNNRVYEIVNGSYQYGVTGFDDKLPLYLQSNSKVPNQRQCEDFSYIALEILFSSYAEMEQFPGSIGEFLNLKFKNSSFYNAPGSREVGDQIIDYYEKEMNIWNGSETWFDLSAQLHCKSGFNEGLQYLTWKRDGFKQFFKYLTKQITPDGSIPPFDVMNTIKLNQEVTNVLWNTSKYAVVTTKNRKYLADHVIVTVSLGILKAHHKNLFKPNLPEHLQLAINAMGYGNIGKIFFEFDVPFWPNDPDWVGYGFLWTNEDKADVIGTDKEWLLDLQMFTKLDQYPNVLEALLAGPRMRYFELLDTNRTIDDSMWMLQKFLGVSLPRPKAMIKTNWLTSKNFLGSYSYMSMKAADLNINPMDLADSLYNLNGKPQVLFAGEHTDPVFSSNAHAAVDSGFTAANKLIDYYNLKQN